MTMSKLCSVCGKEIPEGEDFVIDGQAYCHDCFDDTFIECDCCGAFEPRSKMTVVANGKFVCEDCLDREYAKCDDCGEWFHVDYLYTVNPYCRDEIHVCDHCRDYGDYFTCDHCGDTFSYDHEWAHDDNIIICDDCSDSYYICSECGTIVHVDYTYWTDDDDCDGEPLCRDCYRSNRGSQVIHDYGYKPYPIFGTTGADNGTDDFRGPELTFGVELECDKGENPRAAAEAVCNLTDRVYCKHDGSLDDGYEIVTHPGTLAWHMTCFPWKEICETSLAYGFKSHDAGTCGLHIHIGSRQLGKDHTERVLTTAKLILLTDVLRPELTRFSRRNGESRWAHYNRGIEVLARGRRIRSEQEAADRVYEYCSDDRYLMVNVTNSNTVELRFNRGTLKVNTVLACLQLASNLTLFAKSHTMDECLEAKWDDVVNYQVFDSLYEYVRTRFAAWSANESERPTTTFRVANIENMPAPAQYEGSLLDWENRCQLVLDGCEYDDPREPVVGDVVVCTSGLLTAFNGPHNGSIGTIIEVIDAITGRYRVMWNDPACREYIVHGFDMRIVRRLRNNTVLYPNVMWALAKNSGLVLGDLVRSSDPCARYLNGILYYAESPAWVCVAWDPSDYTSGHNGEEDMLEDTPYRKSGWNVPIELISPIV